jgi:WD40 repeat protein
MFGSVIFLDIKWHSSATSHLRVQVTGLAISDRHPYMFSCGLDKMVKCWDLEQNKVGGGRLPHCHGTSLLVFDNMYTACSQLSTMHIRARQVYPKQPPAQHCLQHCLGCMLYCVQVIRQYHGHLSGVYSIALHPKLDVFMTGGRDSVCRVWDMRTKLQVIKLRCKSAILLILCYNHSAAMPRFSGITGSAFYLHCVTPAPTGTLPTLRSSACQGTTRPCAPS